jgi:hypothetical protein
MAPGPRTKNLNPAQIAWLQNFRREHRYSMPQMNRALASPFKWRTLQRAMDGKGISELSHGYIVQWLERYAPAFAIAARSLSGKDRAAGESENGETDSKHVRYCTACGGDLNHEGHDEGCELMPNESNTKKVGTTGTVRGSR